MLSKNQIFQVTIENYSSEGDGITHIDGCVVFVKGALRGEVCRIRILKALKNLAYAKTEEILQPSCHRIKPVCPVFEKCGGCSLLHMDYEEELFLKHQRVEDALRRIGGSAVLVEPVIGGSREGYRNKVIYAVTPGKNGTASGFFRNHSHDVVPAEHCPVQMEVAEKIAGAVCAWMDENKIPCYDEAARSDGVRHIFVRCGRVSGQAQLTVVSSFKRLPAAEKLTAKVRTACPEAVGIVHNCNKTAGNTVLSGEFETIWGESHLTDTLCGIEFRLSPRSFYQVNHDQAEVLYRKAMELAGLTGSETVLDLYCGTGTITLCAAQKAGKVYGAEIVAEAIEDAEKNKERNGIKNVEFLCADASLAAEKFRAAGFKPDVIIVDPPRKGLAPDVVQCVASMEPKKIVYVSCDPGTLARDVKLFAGLGYAAKTAQPVDMFPGSCHVETVVSLLSRTEGTQRAR